MVTGPAAVLSKIALDEDGVRDNNDRITLLIAITLGQCGLSIFFYSEVATAPYGN